MEKINRESVFVFNKLSIRAWLVITVCVCGQVIISLCPFVFLSQSFTVLGVNFEPLKLGSLGPFALGDNFYVSKNRLH